MLSSIIYVLYYVLMAVLTAIVAKEDILFCVGTLPVKNFKYLWGTILDVVLLLIGYFILPVNLVCFCIVVFALTFEVFMAPTKKNILMMCLIADILAGIRKALNVKTNKALFKHLNKAINKYFNKKSKSHKNKPKKVNKNNDKD